MFTGIVEEIGEVDDVVDLGDAVKLSVRGTQVTSDVTQGESVAVDGCCLTVVTNADGLLTADVMKETLDRTTLGLLRAGSPVNLERAARPTTRMGGHIVQGHVDGLGTVLERTPSRHWETVRVGVARELARYVAAKGSVAVDGVSLTVVDVDDTSSDGGPSFTVSLIPTTLELTTLGTNVVGDPVNLEVDVIAKYVERLVKVGGSLP